MSRVADCATTAVALFAIFPNVTRSLLANSTNKVEICEKSFKLVMHFHGVGLCENTFMNNV